MNDTLRQNRGNNKVLSDKERQKQRKNRRKKVIRNRILLGVFSLIVITVLFFTLPFFKIKSYEIKGAAFSDTTILAEAAAGLKGQNILVYSPKNILLSAVQLPYIEKVNISTGINGVATIQITEKKRDYALKVNDRYLLMDRSGFVLEDVSELPADLTELIDIQDMAQPGANIYNNSEKKGIITEFKDLMDLNLSTVHFSTLDVSELKNIKVKYGGWSVELGDKTGFKEKLNQSINILKELKMEDEGVVDLKYQNSPVIKRKQV